MSDEPNQADAVPKKILSFSDIAKLKPEDRPRESLRLWDALLAKALQKQDFNAALKIAESASDMLRRIR